jgi:DNA-binding CsgD family transcriptional regulator
MSDKARDAARTSKSESDESLRRWRPLTSARWTLVDSFERNGTRYIVARENQAEVRGLASLSDQERQAVAYLALGQSTKQTAYALGISDATVRVLLARAASKLGVRSSRRSPQSL